MAGKNPVSAFGLMGRLKLVAYWLGQRAAGHEITALWPVQQAGHLARKTQTALTLIGSGCAIPFSSDAV